MQLIDIYRTSLLLTTDLPMVSIKPSDNSVQVKRIMGENQLNISFEDSQYIDFKINDYCTVFGEKYILNRLPQVNKTSTYKYRYEMVMQAESADLAKVQYLFLGSDNSLKESDFSLMGNADTFIDLILQNMERLDPGWTKGQVITTPYKSLTFTAENCYNALSRLAEEFDSEFWIINKTIHFTKKSRDTGVLFKHGRYKGLYELIRQNISDSDVITRLYAFGSESNLPENYDGTRLRLPAFYSYTVYNLTCTVTATGGGNSDYVFSFSGPDTTGVTALQVEYRVHGSGDPWTNNTAGYTSPRTLNLPTDTYDFRFRTVGGVANDAVTEIIVVSGDITDPVLPKPSKPYLEKNKDIYGLLEATQIFEDIYPHREGTISSVNALDIYKFIDLAIDFNVNDYLIPGLSAKVVFNTGQLAGYKFEVSGFNNGTKEFTILKNKDEAALELPSSSIKPAIGDKYVLVDIRMPQSYVEAAEEELKTKAQELLDVISQPQVSYQIVLDPVYLRSRNRTLDIGDEVWIVDTQFSINRKYRIISTTRNIVKEFQYQAELSDKVSPGTIQRIVRSLDSSEREITDVGQQFANNQLINGVQIGNLKVQQGTVYVEDIPTTNTETGFSQLRIEDATGRIVKKI